MATRIEASRLLCLRAAWEKDMNQEYAMSSSMAKVFASETAMWTTVEAVQIHGGYGYVKEYAVERFYRDARIMEIYEGASEIHETRVILNDGLGGGAQDGDFRHGAPRSGKVRMVTTARKS